MLEAVVIRVGQSSPIGSSSDRKKSCTILVAGWHAKGQCAVRRCKLDRASHLMKQGAPYTKGLSKQAHTTCCPSAGVGAHMTAHMDLTVLYDIVLGNHDNMESKHV